MKFLDYLFYRMKWWNSKVVLDFSPFISAVIIISVFQGFNILFVLNVVKYYWGFSVGFIEQYYLILPVLLFILNFFYYRLPQKQAKIEMSIVGMSSKQKIMYDVYVVSYFILTLFLLIWIGYLIRLKNL